jgi:hypothetical protein
MRFVQIILKCLAALILAVGLYCLVGNDFAHFLFSTVYSGLPYPLPESIATAFGILLALVVGFYFLCRKLMRFGKRR